MKLLVLFHFVTLFVINTSDGYESNDEILEYLLGDSDNYDRYPSAQLKNEYIAGGRSLIYPANDIIQAKADKVNILRLEHSMEQFILDFTGKK
jgi:hypothetical protein